MNTQREQVVYKFKTHTINCNNSIPHWNFVKTKMGGLQNVIQFMNQPKVVYIVDKTEKYFYVLLGIFIVCGITIKYNVAYRFSLTLDDSGEKYR